MLRFSDGSGRTLERVAGGTLRVGVSHAPPATDVRGEEALKQGDLDLVVGGLTASTPWTDKAALTRPYAETTIGWGRTQKHVLAVPLGENAFLVTLEEFLSGRDAAP